VTDGLTRKREEEGEIEEEEEGKLRKVVRW
jgi:hypothetical protein